jgi:hypothetical protein
MRCENDSVTFRFAAHGTPFYKIMGAGNSSVKSYSATIERRQGFGSASTVSLGLNLNNWC